MENLRIDPLSDDTLDSVLTLVRDVFPDSCERARASIRFAFDPVRYAADEAVSGGYARARDTWVARLDATVVGMVGLYEEYGDSDDVAWLGWFAVASVARGRGIGTALLAFAEDMARARGKRLLKIHTTSGNPDARRLYERSGYALMRIAA